MTVGASTTVIDSDWVATAPRSSVATRVKVEVPPVVGIPVIFPVAGSILSPSGSDPPVNDHR